jgi:hydroxyacylglutathione hydrolase
MTEPMLIVAESEEKVDEAVMRLARVGIESVKGYLLGGMDAWAAAGLESATVPQVSVAELHQLVESDKVTQVIDVRRQAEYDGGHVPRAVHAPLAELHEEIANLTLDRSKPTAVICAGGYRSSAATSILEQEGFKDLLNVTGGTGAWVNAGYGVEAVKGK